MEGPNGPALAVCGWRALVCAPRPVSGQGTCRGQAGLFFSLPLGSTEVMGAIGRSDATGALGADVSFLGFFASFSVRWSPLAMLPPMKGVGLKRLRNGGGTGTAAPDVSAKPMLPEK